MDAQQLKNWLNEELERRPGKSKAELAKALNLEPPAVSKILNGTRQIKAIEYVRILEFLGISANEKGLPEAPPEIKTDHEQTAAGLHEKKHDQGQWSIPADILGQKRPDIPEIVHRPFCINDNKMEPDFKEGEHVLVDSSAKPDQTVQPFLVSDGHNRMVRFCRIIPKSSPRTIEISSKAKGFEPQQLFEKDFDIIGKVVAKIKWT